MMTMDRALLSTNASTSFSGKKIDSRIVETRGDDDDDDKEEEE